MEIELEKTIYEAERMETIRAPQVALAGRSNVGKSSLVNRLAGRKKLARISSTPGKTRSVNFYKVRGRDYYLVDLPGYGYAKASKADREKWAGLVQSYFEANPEVRAVVLLLDSRLDPQNKDLELLSYVEAMDISLIAVLTKADKCKQKERDKRRNQWKALLGGRAPLLFSSRTGMGSEKLEEIIENAALSG
jgi:GTP-binding protein